MEKAREGRSWAERPAGPRWGFRRPRPGWVAGREKKGEKEGDSAQEDRKEFSIFIKHTGMKTKIVWRKIQLRLEMNSERGFKKSLKRSPRVERDSLRL